MIADGCNHRTHFSLSLIDEDIVQKFRKYLKADTEVRYRPSRVENKKPQYCLTVSSVKMCKDLERLGCPLRKTWITDFVSDNIISKILKKHYIRGLVSGDGTIVYHRKRNRWFTNVVGTKALCQGISDFVTKELGFSGNVHKVHKNKNSLHRIAFSGKNQVYKFLNYIHQDCTVYMDRKYQKYQEFLKWYEAQTSS